MTSFHMGARSPECEKRASGDEASKESVASCGDGKQRPLTVYSAESFYGPWNAGVALAPSALGRGLPGPSGPWPLARALVLGLVLGALCAGCGSSAPGTIGAALGQTHDHRLYVRSLPPGQGAEKAGLVLDDEIVEIDGKAVSVMSPEEVRRAVRGDVGTTMVLKIRREGAEKEVKVTRSPLLPDSPAKP
jgi:hypothetical protein